MAKAAQTPRGELALIEQIRLQAGAKRSKTLRLGMGDDCAILAPPAGAEVLVTTDFSLEGRHFLREKHAPGAIGHRVLARGLSDLAAMGAEPLAAFLSLALPREVAADSGWLEAFLKGFQMLAGRTQTPLAGGDTSEAPGPFVLADVTLLGQAPAGTALRRSGARPGDAIYVTGALGGAAAELEEVLAGKTRKTSEHPHLFPEPRLTQGIWLRGRATACMDLSDGISTDLAHLCAASKVGAEIDAALLPIHALARKKADPLRLALHGGEDYELLFTAPAEAKLPKAVRGVPLTRIGRVLKLRKGVAPVTIIDAAGERVPLERGGWEHLQ